ncbi:PREDICTED: possible lysine-specific histone demethylase 1-like isoform X2 [Papilio polytes]|uniref:possible lysine-specific histone demethylase 1-like isoform X2 n=1 Tax=Papilio polytes TaxID=76194 RepID=UPI00067642C1|nr:PREDICTED: possible lysine-specific histone demethylase 1-like isoform X2 [Papilio polytes]
MSGIIMAGRVFAALLFYIALVRADELTMQYDTIVVGLGSAGTTAATTLARAGRRVLALEAQNRIGGRVNTVQFGDGVVELGAEWIHGINPSRVYDTAIKNNITVLSQDLTMDAYTSDGRQADKELVNELIEYCLGQVENTTNDNQPLGDFLTKKLKEHLNATKPSVLEDEDFMENFLDLMDQVVGNYEGSNSWNDVSTFTHYQELSGDQHMSWHRNGYKTFFELLLNTYQGGPGLPNLNIKLNTEVTKIVWPQKPLTPVEVTCSNGEVFKADNVIITVSIGVLKERHTSLFKPSLPIDKVQAIDNLTIGVMDKIVFTFDKAWWPNLHTFFAFLWRREEKKKVLEEDRWITKIFGASTPLGSSNTLTLWTSGDAGKLVEKLPEDVVKRKCIELLQRFLGANTTVPEPTGMLRTTWFTNPYTRGSYSYDSVTSMKYPNSRADLGKPLVDSAGVPKVLFAGEATDLTHFSTVHGASDSGFREAMRLLPSSKL